MAIKYPCDDHCVNFTCGGNNLDCEVYMEWSNQSDGDEDGDEKMGQYFLVVNKTKEQFLYGNAFGDGIKAHEILWNGSMMKALGFLLMKSDSGNDYDLFQMDICGYWAGDEIVIVGDYDSSKLYTVANASYRDVSTTVINAMLHLKDPDMYFQHEGQITEMRERIKEFPPIPFNELNKKGRQKHDPKIEIPENEVMPSFDPEALEII